MLETVERQLPHSLDSAFVLNISISNGGDGGKLLVIKLKM